MLGDKEQEFIIPLTLVACLCVHLKYFLNKKLLKIGNNYLEST